MIATRCAPPPLFAAHKTDPHNFTEQEPAPVVAQSPPYAAQNAQHSAALFRQATFSAFRKGGTVGPADFAVTAQGTPNMSVLVAAGRGWMTGTQLANVTGGNWSPQAAYFGLNDAPVTLTIAAADPTNPRIDLVVAYATDSFYSGATNTFVLGVITGTPAATPAAPAAPNNAITCGTVAVAANATSIVSGNIANTAALLTVARGGVLPVVAGDVVAGEYVGQYRDHPTIGLQRWTGSVWGPPGTDTGWLSMGINAGWTSGTCYYRLIGGICYFVVSTTSSTGITAGYLVATFPVNARPSATVAPMYFDGAFFANVPAPCALASNGQLTVGPAAAGSNGLLLSGSFPVG